ncbi:hypothetical protein ACFX1Z_035331 [Malus domestica]
MLRHQTCLPPMLHISPLHRTRTLNSLPCYATSRKFDSEPDLIARSNPKPKYRSRKAETSEHEGEEPGETFPATIPRKPRRGAGAKRLRLKITCGSHLIGRLRRSESRTQKLLRRKMK